MINNIKIILELKNVDFGYNESLVLSGLNMQFQQGKIIAVIGGSGCGKTTILRLIGGLIKVCKGTIKFNGCDITKLNCKQLYKIRRQMGLLFQFGALFTDLSIFENVLFPLREHINLPEKILYDIALMKLNAVGLRGARNLLPSEISGGMARRVALARTIALDPQIIMYDEPFAGLDPMSLRNTANLIKTLNTALNSTTILVTHDLLESFAIADYVYFIANGKVAARGTPNELHSTNDPIIRQFIDGNIIGSFQFKYPSIDLFDDFEINYIYR